MESDPLGRIRQHRLVPVVAVRDPQHTPRLADALVAGGLPCAEITFRTDVAVAAIRSMADRGDMLVGAGTVLRIEQAQAALDAGATFLVAPGFNPKVVRYCLDRKVPILPGVCTPTEIETALDYGFEMVKFFPAEPFGGVRALKALAAPFPMMRFVPTGGIGSHNLPDYLALPCVVACAGSWMVAPKLWADGDFGEVTRATREAVAAVAHAGDA
jgi:2-dehydro-3-deoxyphosphogluconate aldolase/(4S)-4-hydroxy-2-oxoglutarate aldolase